MDAVAPNGAAPRHHDQATFATAERREALDVLLHQRTPARKEIDFTGALLGGLPYEGKYTEGRWLRGAATVAAAFGRGVLATRNVTERKDDLLAVPAPFVALLLDVMPFGSAGPA